MGNIHTVNCVLKSQVANNNVPGLMKRTCQRMSFKRENLTTPPQAPKLSKLNKKRFTVKLMPRCSSLEDLSVLLPSSKKSDSDPTYLLWKKSFERPREKPYAVKQTHLVRMRRRVHDMSSVISGQLTPKGFPCHTHVKKTQWRLTPNCRKQELSEKKHLQLPQLDDSPRAERKIPVMHSDYCGHLSNHHNYHKNQQQLLLQLPSHIRMADKTEKITSLNSHAAIRPKYTLTPLNLLSKLSQSKQAIIIENLCRDIKDLESFYDTQMDPFVL